MAQGDWKVFRKVGGASQILASLSYLGILTLVPLIFARNDTYVQFHARQGVLIWVWEVLAIYSLALPGIGKIFFQTSSLLCFILSIIGLFSVLLGRAWKIPYIGTLAQKL
ncbi:MAG: hypothetical protein HQL50_07705 [Magnetococcales bacterium]|nr:hypothetical protein [Magnetococcales bacterium]